MDPRRLIRSLLIAQIVVTSMMFGVIWEVQLVTYPQLGEIGSVEFPSAHASHCRRITWVVAPLMSLELILAATLVTLLRKDRLRVLAVAGLLLVATIWLTTALVQVPLHERLSAGREIETVESLVRSNWIRVAAWGLRLGVALALLVRWIERPGPRREATP